MEIKRILNGGLPIESTRGKKAKNEPEKVSSTEDRAEISEEAVSLFRSSEDKRTEEIRSRIQSGYYFQREVTEKVVDEMFRDLKIS